MADYPRYVPTSLLGQAGDHLFEPKAGHGFSALLRYLVNRNHPVINLHQIYAERERRGMTPVPERPWAGPVPRKRRR